MSKVLPAIKENGGEYLAGEMNKTTAIGNGTEQHRRVLRLEDMNAWIGRFGSSLKPRAARW